MRHQGIAHSIASDNAVRHLYAVASPHAGSTVQAQLACAVEQIVNAFSARGGKITHQAVFLRDLGWVEQVELLLRNLYGEGKIPATSYIDQMPCDERCLVALEATGVAGDAAVDYNGTEVTVVRYDGVTWVQTGHSVARDHGKITNAYDRTMQTMEQTKRLLAGVGAHMGQVVRTWFYMGGITADDMGSISGTQRYKELNRARTNFYRHIDFLAGRVPESIRQAVYPASTCVGTRGDDVCLSVLALMTDRSDVLAVPLENPRQVAAFHYGQRYSPQSPKFSRAMAVVHGDQAITYVSGTASITASETQHLGDAARQTEETLENIAALIGEENLAEHGLPGFGTDLRGLGLVRAYLKHLEDYPIVRAICEKRLGGIPVVYVRGDVCREDLLVELEGVAHSTRLSVPGVPPTATGITNGKPGKCTI